jgi:hypothetical protein
LTAADARSRPKLRARVALAADTSDRSVSDLLNGYVGLDSLAERIRRALVAEHVDLATIPQRTPAELLAWKRGRQPRLARALPEGYALEKCDCGRDYPRLQTEATGLCPKCWRRRCEGAERREADARAEIEGLQERLANSARPVLSSVPGGKGAA